MPVKRCVSCSYADHINSDANPGSKTQSQLFPEFLSRILFVLVGMGGITQSTRGEKISMVDGKLCLYYTFAHLIYIAHTYF